MNSRPAFTATPAADSLREAVDFYRFCRDNTYGQLSESRSLRFLDFGSGWGRITRAFLRDFELAHMYGYEPNLLFCTVARALNPYINFVHGSRVPDRSLPRHWFDVRCELVGLHASAGSGSRVSGCRTST